MVLLSALGYVKNLTIRPVAIVFEKRRDQTSTKVRTTCSILAIVSVL
jgi:hypothetical protein